MGKEVYKDLEGRGWEIEMERGWEGKSCKKKGGGNVNYPNFIF